MPNFRITRRGAKHRRKENGNWVQYSAADKNEITLTQAQYESGAYSHLGLEPVFATETKAAPVDQDTLNLEQPDKSVNPPMQDNITDGSRTPDGNQMAAAVAGDNETSDTPDTTEDVNNEDISTEELNKLIDEVEESRVNDGSFEKARKKVIRADIFEESTLPDTKSGVLQALIDYREGLSEE